MARTAGELRYHETSTSKDIERLDEETQSVLRDDSEHRPHKRPRAGEAAPCEDHKQPVQDDQKAKEPESGEARTDLMILLGDEAKRRLELAREVVRGIEVATARAKDRGAQIPEYTDESNMLNFNGELLSISSALDHIILTTEYWMDDVCNAIKAQEKAASEEKSKKMVPEQETKELEPKHITRATVLHSHESASAIVDNINRLKNGESDLPSWAAEHAKAFKPDTPETLVVECDAPLDPGFRWCLLKGLSPQRTFCLMFVLSCNTNNVLPWIGDVPDEYSFNKDYDLYMAVSLLNGGQNPLPPADFGQKPWREEAMMQLAIQGVTVPYDVVTLDELAPNLHVAYSTKNAGPLACTISSPEGVCIHGEGTRMGPLYVYDTDEDEKDASGTCRWSYDQVLSALRERSLSK